MFKNYLKTAWRNLRRNRTFSFINIVGLSIGISASLVIYLLVSYDLTFDRGHKDGDRIYRVVSEFVFSGEPGYNSGVPMPMPAAAQKEVAGLDLVVPFFTWGDEKVSIPRPGGEAPAVFKKQSHIVFADERYFRMIPYEWLAGSPKTSLSRPMQLVLTESMARKYFPNLNRDEIVGQKVYFNDTITTVVSGIVKDLAYHTDFTFQCFISGVSQETPSFKQGNRDNWGSTNSSSQLFVKLSPGGRPAQVEARLAALYKKYTPDEKPGYQTKTTYRLQPLSDLHFNHDYGNFFDDDHLAHKPTLYSLLVVAAILLLLGCINFINLTTAQSTQRAKEIGIRKTIGSSRRQLLLQFLSETFVLTLLASLLSVILIPFLLKIFADFIPKELHFNIIREPGVLVFLLLLVVAVSLLSGFYPAAVLSSFRPVLVLKNQGSSGRSRRAWLRKTLTVSQFIIAQVFIIATLLVSKQIRYSLHKDLGFKKDAIVYFHTKWFDPNKDRKLVLLNKIRALPGITAASLCSDVPSSQGTWSTTMKYKGRGKDIGTEVQVKFGDTNYLRLFQIRLAAGHELPGSDTIREMLINETFARVLGFSDPKAAIGEKIEWNGKPIPVAGVVADFHQKSLHDPIKPLAIGSRLMQEGVISIALAPQNPEGNSWKTTIGKIGKAWSEVYPDDEFEYKFQDETIAKFYKSEQDIVRLLTWATGLAILISCLGLLGLVIFITNQRVKEIGIRKIVGATVMQLIALLSADFLKLILLAFLIAVPLAWWGAHKWLQGFAYQTELSWWIFAGGGLLMLLIALVVLLLKTFKAATANPVSSLRAE